MSNKVVIAGSASLQEEIHVWKNIWEHQGYIVTNWPRTIPKDEFFQEYP